MHNTKEWCLTPSSLPYSPIIFMAAAGMYIHVRPKLSSFSPGTLNTHRDQNAKVKGSIKEVSCSFSICLFASVISYLPIKSLFHHTEARKAFKHVRNLENCRHCVKRNLEGSQDLVTPGVYGRAVAWASRSAVVWENALSHRANIANTLLSIQCWSTAECRIHQSDVQVNSACFLETFLVVL